MFRRLTPVARHAALTLVVCTMLLRMVMPAGWMPTTSSDGAMRIAMCTAMGAQTVWIDHDGKLHKDMPASGHHDPQPCGFGALATGLGNPGIPALPMPHRYTPVLAISVRRGVAIGHGLVAPPPPPTGPPSLS